MKRSLVFVLALAAGCAHSQMPPTVHSVTITITPPSGASGAAYVISRATGSTCPVSTGSAYTPLNQSAPISGTSYVDSAAAGLSVCYIAQTVEGGAVSAPSNIVGPFVVPANPTAPSINGQSAKNETPAALPGPTLAKNEVPQCGFVVINGAVEVHDCTAGHAGPQIHAVVR